MKYRVGEMLLSATGTFAADSGRSIFLEQHLEQRGRKYFRWEIPYPYIHHIEIEANSVPADNTALASPYAESARRSATASAGESAGGSPSVLPFPPRPKTA